MTFVDGQNADYLDQLADHAADHWWYEARRALARQVLNGRIPRGGTAIDVGCGTGELLGVLGELGATRRAGTDLSTRLLADARARQEGSAAPGARFATALAEALPFPDGLADALTSMDVLEHLDDDLVGLREFHRLLRPGATLFVTVPAYRSLWCAFDDHAGHRRRYRRNELVKQVRAAGFVVERSSYFFSFLAPPAFALRRTPLRRLIRGNDEELSSSSPAVTAVLRGLCEAERRALAAGATIPAGLSIFCLAQRA